MAAAVTATSCSAWVIVALLTIDCGVDSTVGLAAVAKLPISACTV